MKRVSQIYRPTLSIPKDAILKHQESVSNSHRLLQECGLVRPSAPGCFALLPLAIRSLNKLLQMIRRSLDAVGGQEIVLPALEKASTWKKTGRLESMKDELFLLKDRHDRGYLLSPTHEEMITELLAGTAPISHNQLPILLYQITNKYRDEKRPRHGLLRSREFLMCDAYGFHVDSESAQDTYARVTGAYDALFRQLRVPYHRVSADSGAMGGSESHEWHYAAAAGEDVLLACDACNIKRRRDEESPADDEKCRQCGGRCRHVQSIEIAHTFVLGDRYSSALGLTHTRCRSPINNVVMSCYGVGVTRLLGAGVEALSTPDKLRWPSGIAPYTVAVIGPKEGSNEYKSGGHQTALKLVSEMEGVAGLAGDVLLDDRDHLTVGKRLVDNIRMGYPMVMVVGRKGFELHTYDSTHVFPSRGELFSAVKKNLDEMDDQSKCE